MVVCTWHSSYKVGSANTRFYAQVNPGIKGRSYLKTNKSKKGMVQVVQCLSSKGKVKFKVQYWKGKKKMSIEYPGKFKVEKRNRVLL
jgi:hypothetical protein